MQNNVPIPSGFDIYWEPWVDAFSTEDVSNNVKQMFEDQLSEMEQQLSPEELEAMEAMEAMDGVEEMADMEFFERPIKTILTPFGVLPLTENSLASNHFKFWVGHSNFKLLENYYAEIESCRGVESIDILTPYRFRIAVGKMFRDRDVMYEVREKLLGIVNES